MVRCAPGALGAVRTGHTRVEAKHTVITTCNQHALNECARGPVPANTRVEAKPEEAHDKQEARVDEARRDEHGRRVARQLRIDKEADDARL